MRLINLSRLEAHLIGPFFAMLAMISFKLLLDDNVGMVNEIDVLPLAKQFADPTWIPKDWYLNQAPGYRLLFATIFGNLIVAWGFLATSIAGRLLCYSLVAWGLVLIGKRLGLNLLLLLTAVGIFLYVNPEQGAAAQEWLIGGLEAKAIAYGLVLVAIAYLLRQQYTITAFLLGLATSFHVLVGGWSTLVAVGQILLKHRTQPRELRHFWRPGLIYLLLSSFAIPPVISHLFSGPTEHEISPSFIYVFLRLPHHLNPASWEPFRWVWLLSYLFCLFLCMRLLHRQRKTAAHQTYQAQVDLFQLTLLSLVPFTIGLIITPFDQSGNWLQFYPFRVGDVLLPLNTCLLLACAVQQSVTQQKVVYWVCIGLITIKCVLQFPEFQNQIVELKQFPDRNPDFLALCDWVKTKTPPEAIIISPPVEYVDFSWLTERPTIAKYKLLPQTKTRIVEWYNRLADLSGGKFPQPANLHTRDVRDDIRSQLTEGYYQLNEEQVKALIEKYAASYLMTTIDHQLSLPIAYRNDQYILYAASASTKN